MFIFLSFLICLATAAFIGAPLFQRGNAAYPSGAAERARSRSSRPTSELEERRDTLLLSLKELEFDRSMNKIDGSDYERLRAEMTAEAAAVLRQLDATDASADSRGSPTLTTQQDAAQHDAVLLDAGIEAEVLIARERHRRARANSAQENQNSASGWKCTECGRAMGESDRFCATCGAARVPQPTA